MTHLTSNNTTHERHNAQYAFWAAFEALEKWDFNKARHMLVSVISDTTTKPDWHYRLGYVRIDTLIPVISNDDDSLTAGDIPAIIHAHKRGKLPARKAVCQVIEHAMCPSFRPELRLTWMEKMTLFQIYELEFSIIAEVLTVRCPVITWLHERRRKCTQYFNGHAR